MGSELLEAYSDSLFWKLLGSIQYPARTGHMFYYAWNGAGAWRRRYVFCLGVRILSNGSQE